MKFELSLLELNELYYLASKSFENKTESFKTRKEPDTMNYFVRELSKSKKLRDKLQNYLFQYVNELDEVKTERDYSAFKEYADSMNDAQSEDRALGNI